MWSGLGDRQPQPLSLPSLCSGRRGEAPPHARQTAGPREREPPPHCLTAWRQRRGRDRVTGAGASGLPLLFPQPLPAPSSAPPPSDPPHSPGPAAAGTRGDPQHPASARSRDLLLAAVLAAWYLPKTQHTEGFRGPSLFQGPVLCGHRTQRHQQAGQVLCSLSPKALCSLLVFWDSVGKRTKENGW